MRRRHGWTHLKAPRQKQRLLVAALLTCLGVMRGALAAEGTASGVTLDPAFSPGLATLKHANGFMEDPPNRASTDWRPNLQLLVGVKAIEGSKTTICFVQLTTLPSPPTNSHDQPWQPALRTNHWGWPPTNKAEFVTAIYPVHARVFDGTGRLLKEGQTPMAWGMLTNGLLDLCRISLKNYRRQTNSIAQSDGAELAAKSGEREKSAAPMPEENEALMRATGGGFLWMIGMFGDFQTVPAVADVWAQAQCAIRWPSLWTVAKSLVTGFSLELLPRTEDVALANIANDDPAGPLYRLPVDLNSDKRNLCHVEIIVGPAHGAEMLLAGIRSIRAVHPTRQRHEFLAQVLAAGSVREDK